MEIATLYLIAGVALFGGYDKYGPAAKVSYWFLFPVHAPVLIFVTSIVTCKESIWNNPVWWLIGALLCLVALS